MKNIHQVSGRRRFGLLLALVTVSLWGTAPLALEIVLRDMDAYTVTFYRFLLAALLLAPFIIRRYGIPSREKFRGAVPWLVAGSALFLSGNYILFMFGLDVLLPGATIVLIQLAPAFLLIGGVLIFRERYSLRQFFGFMILLGGLGLFFNDKIGVLTQTDGAYRAGALLVVASALSWTGYALCQKQLLNTFSSGSIMLMIYIGGALFFLPLSRPGDLLHLNGIAFTLLIYTALNTLLAYGAFAESLEHLEASRVSAIVATGPLWVIIFIKSTNFLFPGMLRPEPINLLSIAGAGLVVAGSMINSLSGIQKQDGAGNSGPSPQTNLGQAGKRD